ncbi:MAG: GatB/YqeY domain-containing protein [Mariprofundaceae bacterium]|nr:GatB/YqeY domain-containing protein [Mariprofundaceae bacterium]
MLNQITADMKEAMKAGDKPRLNVIRMLRAALKDKEIAAGEALSTDDVIAVVGRLIKQRKDSATQYSDADRQDLADKELAEIEVLNVYMPAQMDEAAITQAVSEAIAASGASGMKDMGKVMGQLKALQGQADMGLVSAQVKALLQA